MTTENTTAISATAYEQLQVRLRAEPATWLVTGVAGFIGSNLLVSSGWTTWPPARSATSRRCKPW
jgi:hypothetical protein